MEKAKRIQAFQTICDLLDEAKRMGIDAEIAFYALLEMKKNPKLEPEEAFLIAYQEWVK